MDKKALIILIIIVALVLAGGFLFFKYSKNNQPEIQNNIGGLDTELEVVAEPGSGEGGGDFTVCLDQCGDGICQADNGGCTGFDCTCAETAQECPQDCKN